MRLPDELRRQVESRLTELGFHDYQGLARWLQQQGYKISPASLRRYGASLTGSMTTEPAERHAKVEALPDCHAATTEDLMRLAHEMLYSALAEIKQLRQGDLSRLAHAVAHLTQAAISLQRWTIEVHQRMEEHKHADFQPESAIGRGLSPETSQALRNVLIGFSPLDAEAKSSQGAATGESEAGTPATTSIADEFEKSETTSRTMPAAPDKETRRRR